MEGLKTKKEKNATWLFIFLCWLIYSVSYLGKVNYSANITQIIDFYDITKAEAGMAPTFFFFAYGIGQVLNGILCKKYNIKWVIFLSMLSSAIINLSILFVSEFYIIKWLWMINGFTLSMLWPTLVRLISEALPKRDLGKSSVIMGTTVAAGTLVTYALSSIYAVFNKFKLAFLTASLAGIIVAVIWMLLYKKAVSLAKKEQAKENIEIKVQNNTENTSQQKKDNKRMLLITVYILCFCAIGVNLIKDGLTTWVPSILKEEYSMSDSISILLTLLLPIVAIFGNLFALNMHKKIPDYINHCAVVFAVMFGFIYIIIGSLTLKQAIVMIIGLVVVNLLASSLNSLITSIFPIFMRGRVNSGLYAGILNGFCYLGSTISSYGLGVIADFYGWAAVFYTLLGFCALMCFVWCVYTLLKRYLIA